MTTRRRKTGERAPREAAFPHRYGRSKVEGTPFRVTTAGRDDQGRKLYRLAYVSGGRVIRGNREWTADELMASGARWMTRRPSEFVAVEKGDR